MMLIKGGRVLDPKTGMDEITDIVIEHGRIEKTGCFCREEFEQVLDAEGLVVAPGLVDVHVHFRDPGFLYKEDIFTGAKAAAKGGFTTVICMANTKPVVDRVETLQYVLEKGRQTGIHVLCAAAVTKGLKGEELTDMEALFQAGAAGFTDDGIPLREERLIVRAMEEAKRLGAVLSFHEEDPDLIGSLGVNRGAVSEFLGLAGAPAVSEDVMVARDCMLALHTGAAISIQHISSKNSVSMVRLAKSLGARVYAEATPHHFSLTEEAVKEFKTCAKMNPPLRTKEDRLAIIEGLRDKTIDCIATDHAPHSREEKEQEFSKAPSGIIGLETSLALGVTNLVRTKELTLLQLLEKMTWNPARIYGLDCGCLEPGKRADLVIFDEAQAFRPEKFVSKSANSPFANSKLYGKVKYTICEGNIVYREE